MKKLLALVLALVMTLGLATVGANAAYTDADDVSYTQAVEVMTAAGVFGGMGDGTFSPKTELTRAQGAKIIAYLDLGADTAEALPAVQMFSDVAAEYWGAKYIAYCANAGIVGGVGDNKFDPDGKLTGYAFGKMLLCVLGYDAKIEGFGGENWEINVAKQLGNASIDTVKKAGSLVLTREEAAQYALDAIMAETVEYATKGTTIAVGDANVVVGSSTAKPVTSTANWADAIDDDFNADGLFVELGEKLYKGDLTAEGTTDDYGRPCRVWTYDNAKVGTYAAIDSLLGTFTKKVSKKDVYGLLGSTTYEKLDRGTAEAYMFLDGKLTGTVNVDAATDVDLDDIMNKNNTGAVNGTANGVTTEIYLRKIDGVDRVGIISYKTYVFKTVGDYNASAGTIRITEAGDTDTKLARGLSSYSIKVEDCPGIEGLKDGTYVLVNAYTNGAGTAKYTVDSVEEATVVSGAVDKYTYNATNNEGSDITISGTTYKYSTVAGAKTLVQDYVVGQTAAIVTDKNDYIVAVDAALVAGDYLIVRAWGSTSDLKSDAIADVVFADGSKGTIHVKQAYDYANTQADVKTQNTIANWAANNTYRWYSYSKNANNEYTLYQVSATKYGYATDTYAAATAVVNDAAVAYLRDGTLIPGGDKEADATYASENTVLILRESDGTVTAYTGVKNIPAVSITSGNANVYALYRKDGSFKDYASLVYVELTGTATVSGSANDNLIYVKQYDKTEKNDGNTVFRYVTLGWDEKETTVLADSLIDAGDGNTDAYYVANYARTDKDGTLTAFTKAAQAGSVVAAEDATSALYPVSASGNTLLIANNAKNGRVGYTLADDAQIMLITVKNANALNTDADAAYEMEILKTPEALASRLSTVAAYTYDYAGRVTENGGSVLKELYVTVTAASSDFVPVVGVTNTSTTAEKAAALTAVKNELAEDNAVVKVSNSLEATTAITVGSSDTLEVAKDLVIANDASGDTSIAGEVSVGGNAEIDDNVTITGTVEIAGLLDIKTNGHVTVAAGGTLIVDGQTITNDLATTVYGGKITISGTSLVVEAGASVELKGDTEIKGKFQIKGGTSSYAGGLATITGNVTFGATGALLQVDAGTVTNPTADGYNPGKLVVNGNFNSSGVTNTNDTNGVNLKGEIVVNGVSTVDTDDFYTVANNTGIFTTKQFAAGASLKSVTASSHGVKNVVIDNKGKNMLESGKTVSATQLATGATLTINGKLELNAAGDFTAQGTSNSTLILADGAAITTAGTTGFTAPQYVKIEVAKNATAAIYGAADDLAVQAYTLELDEGATLNIANASGVTKVEGTHLKNTDSGTLTIGKNATLNVNGDLLTQTSSTGATVKLYEGAEIAVTEKATIGKQFTYNEAIDQTRTTFTCGELAVDVNVSTAGANALAAIKSLPTGAYFFTSTSSHYFADDAKGEGGKLGLIVFYGDAGTYTLKVTGATSANTWTESHTGSTFTGNAGHLFYVDLTDMSQSDADGSLTGSTPDSTATVAVYSGASTSGTPLKLGNNQLTWR